MKRQLRTLILAISFLTINLFFVGCEKEFKLSNNAEKRLVLLSSFTPDSLFRVTVSTSFPIGDPEVNFPVYADNVDIQLFEDGNPVGNFNFINNNSETPYYLSDFRPKQDSEYSIRASLDDFPVATSSNSIPTSVDIGQTSTISIDSFLIADYYYTDVLFYEVKTRLNLPESVNDAKYFHLTAWRNMIDSYGYILAKQEVVINLANNVQQTEILHETGSLFEGQVFVDHPDGIEFTLSFTYDPLFEQKTPIYLELRHVSEDYFLFHKSIGQQEVTSFQTGLLANQSVLIYNNIENGVGNFGGYSLALDSIQW